METSAQRNAWGVLFAIKGEVDHLEGRRLFDDLYRWINGPLVIDVSGVEYIDTGGIAAIMEVLKHVRTRGEGVLVIARPNPHVKEIFQIAGFSKLSPWLLMAGTMAEAVSLAEQWKSEHPGYKPPSESPSAS